MPVIVQVSSFSTPVATGFTSADINDFVVDRSLVLRSHLHTSWLDTLRACSRSNIAYTTARLGLIDKSLLTIRF